MTRRAHLSAELSPERNVEPGHVVRDVAIEVEQHASRGTHQLRYAVDLITVLAYDAGEHCSEVREHLKGEAKGQIKISDLSPACRKLTESPSKM